MSLPSSQEKLSRDQLYLMLVKGAFSRDQLSMLACELSPELSPELKSLVDALIRAGTTSEPVSSTGAGSSGAGSSTDHAAAPPVEAAPPEAVPAAASEAAPEAAPAAAPVAAPAAAPAEVAPEAAPVPALAVLTPTPGATHLEAIIAALRRFSTYFLSAMTIVLYVLIGFLVFYFDPREQEQGTLSWVSALCMLLATEPRATPRAQHTCGAMDAQSET
jgi:hypothetical protein